MMETFEPTTRPYSLVDIYQRVHPFAAYLLGTVMDERHQQPYTIRTIDLSKDLKTVAPWIIHPRKKVTPATIVHISQSYAVMAEHPSMQALVICKNDHPMLQVDLRYNHLHSYRIETTGASHLLNLNPRPKLSAADIRTAIYTSIFALWSMQPADDVFLELHPAQSRLLKALPDTDLHRRATYHLKTVELSLYHFDPGILPGLSRQFTFSR